MSQRYFLQIRKISYENIFSKAGNEIVVQNEHLDLCVEVLGDGVELGVGAVGDLLAAAPLALAAPAVGVPVGVT